jgi:hypothetical protein
VNRLQRRLGEVQRDKAELLARTAGCVLAVAVGSGCGCVYTRTVAWGVAVVDWQWRVWIEGISAVILSGRKVVVGAVAVAHWQGGTMAVAGGSGCGCGKYTHSGVGSGSG